MTKSDERAAKARSLILKGEQKSAVAETCGYKSIGGMMNAITMLEHKEKIGKGTSNKERRSLQSFEPYTGPTTQAEQRKREKSEKIDILALADQAFEGGIRVDVERDNGLYARIEGKHLLTSYIGYRKSLCIAAKHVPGRQIRLFETELGYKGAMLEALKELRDTIDKMIALLES